MAFSHGSAARVYVNGYDLSAYLKSVSFSGVNDVADVSALSNTAKAYLAGLQDATLTAEGMFDPTAGRTEDLLRTTLGGTCTWTHFPAGTALAARAVGLYGTDTSYEISTSVDDAAMVTAEAQSSTGRDAMTVHRSGGTVTGGGTATAQNNTSGTNNGGVAYLQCISLNGGTATVKVQHSSDDITYSDLITFTNVTASLDPLAERATSSGTVHQYTRATWTVTGGTADFIVAFGRK